MASQIPIAYYRGTAATAKDIPTIIGTTIPETCSFAYVQCETQNCRWRDDGTSPTSSVGMLLTAGQVLIVTRAQFTNFKLIEVAASAVVNVELFK